MVGMKWLARRFGYTRELSDRVRELGNEVRMLEVIKRGHEGIIGEWEQTETTFSKMTLTELETVLTALVEYHDILSTRLMVGDPVEAKIVGIFEKYDITYERNTLVDKVIKEAEEYAKNASRRSTDDK
jgi:hypothetical protein